MKITDLLVFRVWMRTLMTWTGAAGIAYGLSEIFSGAASAWWLVGTFVVYQVSMFTLSVGYHRLFTHRAFETSRFWNWFFAIWGVGFGNGSAFTWTYIHSGHHLYADTPKDPHYTTWKYFFRLKHKPLHYKIPRLRWMLRDPVFYYTHKYAMLWVALFPVLAAIVSWKFFLFCYLLPMGWQQITGGIFYLYSHDKNGALSRPLIGLVFPTAGEWYHADHHVPGHANRLNYAHLPWHYDFGYLFARIIRNVHV